MSKRQILSVLGIAIMVFLFLGFPSGWDKAIALIIGFAILIIAFRMAPPSRPVSPTASSDQTYIEHKSGNDAAAITNPDTTGA